MKNLIAYAAITLALVGAPVVVSAQDPNPASPIVVTGKYQKDWDKGSKLEADGLKDLDGSKRDLVKYSAEVVNAQNKRDNSRSRADNARETFESLTARPYFSDPDDARKWAKQVESAASDWAKYNARQDDGAKELKKAQSRQADAQEAVDKAQAKIDKGRTMMAEAERASLRQASR